MDSTNSDDDGLYYDDVSCDKPIKVNSELFQLDLELDNSNIRYFNNEFLGFIEYEEYTCVKCILQKICDCAFDAYNTNGDCLASK